MTLFFTAGPVNLLLLWLLLLRPSVGGAVRNVWKYCSDRFPYPCTEQDATKWIQSCLDCRSSAGGLPSQLAIHHETAGRYQPLYAAPAAHCMAPWDLSRRLLGRSQLNILQLLVLHLHGSHGGGVRVSSSWAYGLGILMMWVMRLGFSLYGCG